MNADELNAQAQDLAERLGGKVPVETLRTELERYIVQYGIAIEAARSGIIKKYSAPRASAVSSAAVTKKIAELQGDEMMVNITAKLVFVEKKEITVKGAAKTIFSGIAGDETGTAPFTIWSDEGDYEKGSVYVFNKAYTKRFKDQVQINIGSRGSVTPAEGVTIEVAGRSAAPAKTVAIGDITDKDNSVTVTGKILDISPRNVTVRGEDRTVWGGMIADATGKIQFSVWEDLGLTAGSVVTIENAYIRSWKGIPQLNIGNNSVVSASNADLGDVSSGSAMRTVEEVSRAGGIDITISGIIVDVKTGSGLIKRCPECRRSIVNGSCSVHGVVDSPVSDLRLKTTLDDGTGAISVIIGRADTEKLSGITLEEAEASARDLGDPSAISNRIAAKVILKRITVTGNVIADDKFGPQMSARSLQEVATDVKAEAERLYEEVEEGMM